MAAWLSCCLEGGGGREVEEKTNVYDDYDIVENVALKLAQSGIEVTNLNK